MGEMYIDSGELHNCLVQRSIIKTDLIFYFDLKVKL
jgi:hypothetical protein